MYCTQMVSLEMGKFETVLPVDALSRSTVIMADEPSGKALLRIELQCMKLPPGI